MKRYSFSELIKFDLNYLKVLINDLVEEGREKVFKTDQEREDFDEYFIMVEDTISYKEDHSPLNTNVNLNDFILIKPNQWNEYYKEMTKGRLIHYSDGQRLLEGITGWAALDNNRINPNIPFVCWHK